MPTIASAATIGADRTTRSGGRADSAARTTAASPRIPIVCDTDTAAPRPSAWRGVPRVPTRYAAISVFPWPGVRAWPAPRSTAVANASSASAGVTGSDRRMSGIAPSPPGTAPVPEDPDVATPAAGAVDAAAEADGEGASDGAGAADAEGVAAGPAMTTGSTGSASATSNGASTGPPGVAVNAAVRTSGAEASEDG